MKSLVALLLLTGAALAQPGGGPPPPPPPPMLTNNGGNYASPNVSSSFTYSGTGTLYMTITPIYADGSRGSTTTCDSATINGNGNETLVAAPAPNGANVVGWATQGYIFSGFNITAVSNEVLISKP